MLEEQSEKEKFNDYSFLGGACGIFEVFSGTVRQGNLRVTKETKGVADWDWPSLLRYTDEAVLKSDASWGTQCRKNCEMLLWEHLSFWGPWG